tara:strand:- start:682 stop:798 length:117 start_codon:yes stop_codon:yes gene_type:complete
METKGKAKKAGRGSTKKQPDQGLKDGQRPKADRTPSSA